MPSVNQGAPVTITLQAGETLRVVSDANSNGLVRRLGDKAGFQRSGSQEQSVPASSTRVFGPATSARRYSIEVAVGSLTYTTSVEDLPYSNLLGNIEGFTGSKTLRAEDNGKFLRCDDASNVTITVQNDLPQGFNVSFSMWSTGTITVAAASGATNRSTTSALSTQYQLGSLIVMKNAGTAAEYVLTGGFA
jgi:hypothetical protein